MWSIIATTCDGERCILEEWRCEQNARRRCALFQEHLERYRSIEVVWIDLERGSGPQLQEGSKTEVLYRLLKKHGPLTTRELACLAPGAGFKHSEPRSVNKVVSSTLCAMQRRGYTKVVNGKHVAKEKA